MKKEILCLDCGYNFTVSINQTKKAKAKGKHIPTHCLACRSIRWKEERTQIRRVKNLKGIIKMKNIDLAKMICKALEKAEKESRGNVYILTPNTMKKARVIEKVLASMEYEICFDRVSNALEIGVSGYVFDSCITDLKAVFSIVDLFVIDSLSNGKVCIEMKILNAAEILRRS